MRIFINDIIPPRGFSAMNLFGFLFCRQEPTKVTINHELIHTAQGKELLWIGFYAIYALEWLFWLLIYLDTKRAYYAISFEREAYEHQYEMNYLDNRKHWQMWR